MGNIDIRKFNRDIDSWTIFRCGRIKTTTPRTEIFEIFQRAQKPLCAEDILVILPKLSPATIYRTLCTFEKIEFIRRVSTEHSPRNNRIYYEI